MPTLIVLSAGENEVRFRVDEPISDVLKVLEKNTMATFKQVPWEGGRRTRENTNAVLIPSAKVLFCQESP